MEFKGTIYLGDELTDVEIFQNLPEELKSFYLDINGIIAFNGGLHIRGCVLDPDWHSLRHVWVGDSALFRVFNALSPKDIPFAQDCLGDQYFLRMGSVWSLMVDTGEIDDLEIELYDFLEDAILDPVEFLGLEPLVQFLDDGQVLEPGFILKSIPPFSIEADHYVLEKVSTMQRLTEISRSR